MSLVEMVPGAHAVNAGAVARQPTAAVHDQGLLGRLWTTEAVADSRRLTSRVSKGEGASERSGF